MSADSKIIRIPHQMDSVGLDLACLEKNVSEILADLLVIKEARDRKQEVTLEEIRDLEDKAKFLLTLMAILRLKIQYRSPQP